MSIQRDWFDDLRTATALLTRIPMSHPHGERPPNLARAGRLFPLVGGLIGLAIGVVYEFFLGLNLPGFGAAFIALGLGCWLTGAMHEDGLADFADGLGGTSRERKLEIMRDSRLGTYGALALIVVLGAKAGSMTVLPIHGAIPALVAAHALGRMALPAIAYFVPPARSDGLAAEAGRPGLESALIAAGIALVIALVALPLGTAINAFIAAGLAALAIAWLAHRQLGGHTGDVLGAAEQAGEVAVLLVISSSWYE
jgi:adenosylcobinamide-GDP ribazoletransferase